jgi:hypothetical protein
MLSGLDKVELNPDTYLEDVESNLSIQVANLRKEVRSMPLKLILRILKDFRLKSSDSYLGIINLQVKEL